MISHFRVTDQNRIEDEFNTVAVAVHTASRSRYVLKESAEDALKSREEAIVPQTFVGGEDANRPALKGHIFNSKKKKADNALVRTTDIIGIETADGKVHAVIGSEKINVPGKAAPMTSAVCK
jgi:hypothetical protein